MAFVLFPLFLLASLYQFFVYWKITEQVWCPLGVKTGWFFGLGIAFAFGFAFMISWVVSSPVAFASLVVNCLVLLLLFKFRSRISQRICAKKSRVLPEADLADMKLSEQQ